MTSSPSYPSLTTLNCFRNACHSRLATPYTCSRSTDSDFAVGGGRPGHLARNGAFRRASARAARASLERSRMCRSISFSVGSGSSSVSPRSLQTGTNVESAVDWKLYCCPSRMLVSRKTAVGIDIYLRLTSFERGNAASTRSPTASRLSLRRTVADVVGQLLLNMPHNLTRTSVGNVFVIPVPRAVDDAFQSHPPSAQAMKVTTDPRFDERPPARSVAGLQAQHRARRDLGVATSLDHA